jgi:hypothetical protein
MAALHAWRRLGRSAQESLGFRFLLRQYGQIGVLLSAKTERRLAATIRQMTPPSWGWSITACLDGLSCYLTGWMARYRLCSADAIKGLGVVDAHIRRRIRAIIVRQKKRPRFLLRHLLALEVGRSAAAGAAYCGRGARKSGSVRGAVEQSIAPTRRRAWLGLDGGRSSRPIPQSGFGPPQGCGLRLGTPPRQACRFLFLAPRLRPRAAGAGSRRGS